MARWTIGGRLGISAAALVWTLSIVALGLAMNSNMAAADAARFLRLHSRAPEVAHLHAGAVFFAAGCTVLQIAAGLLAAFTLRAAYRWRTAACYAIAIVAVIVANAFALLGLLVWIHSQDSL